jgi:RNA polymerase-binding transcription factor DksA
MVKQKPVVKFPLSILKPIGSFLSHEAKKLEKRKKNLADADPFRDTGRVSDNASPDTDASEQFGHQRVTALQAQADRKLIQIKKALARIKIGKYGICEHCGRMIDTNRLMVMPETTICSPCAQKKAQS